MRIMIDIPDHLYKLLKDFPSDSNEGTIENVLMKAVENGTVLPDNATNSDIMLTMFPDETDLHTFARHNKVAWWNAPYQYQKGGKK